MKYYIASSLTNTAQVRRIMGTLDTEGHICTYDWTVESDKSLVTIAREELEAIRASDVLIFVPRASRGHHVELGYAMALQKPTILFFDFVVDHIPFYYLCQYSVGTMDELVNKMASLQVRSAIDEVAEAERQINKDMKRYREM